MAFRGFSLPAGLNAFGVFPVHIRDPRVSGPRHHDLHGLWSQEFQILGTWTLWVCLMPYPILTPIRFVDHASLFKGHLVLKDVGIVLFLRGSWALCRPSSRSLYGRNMAW